MLAEWATIAPPSDAASFHVLRADSRHPLDFRIGRDARGRFAFQLDAHGSIYDSVLADPPAGFDVLADNLGGQVTRLTLLLHDRDDFEIFRVLCADFLEITRGFAREEAPRAVRILLGRLRQWQEVLARRRQRLLSRNEILGLVGELLFMRDILRPRLGLPLAISTWRGPFGDEQDFALGSIVIEVKTQGITADRRIQISSEDQLDTSRSRVVLCQQGAAVCSEDNSTGISLNRLASSLLEESALTPDARARLELGLDAAGWHEHPEYNELWRLVDRTYFEVTEGFPRIVPSDLRPGVERVGYQILSADCFPFRIEEADLIAELGV